MHDCTFCEGACYCDMEDHQSETPDDCEGCGGDDEDYDDDEDDY